ncbi:MAG: hypothetical protein JW750_07310 [Anaerolineaceae bacterium]|nr:hypothetical protein [Anaerolineaceae bacterium]
MTLYKKNQRKTLDPALFRNPTSEYRGTPFWSWNNVLDQQTIIKQIDQMKAMGMGGFHMHCRTGLATEYLSDEYMKLIKAANEKAKQENMLAWLYDEDRWPSGAAGGIVTKDIRFRARYLVFSPFDEEQFLADKAAFDAAVEAGEEPDGYFIARYAVRLEGGYMTSYRRLSAGEAAGAGEKAWNAYLEISRKDPWFNGQTYVDTLNKTAVEKFIEVTHERYFEVLGEDFGGSVPAIFTDEPQFTHKESLKYAEEENRVILPYTDDFADTYQAMYGRDLLASLPELFWELPDGQKSVSRYLYHEHLSERFTVAFADTVGAWCEEHNIMLTGHMMEEPTLFSQTRALGEAMRSYRSFQLPGIDMLCDWRELSTAKQTQSATHQYGREGVLSELYGVTNWDFPFKNHKVAGDWQAALGVTVRVHHLTWVSMEGEAKRDYPASIGYQSPWYQEYPLIEDHFSRLNTALTRGKPRVKIGVVHPVESCWLYWGPWEQTFQVREELDQNFKNVIDWLLLGLLDFDFIAESLLPEQCADGGSVPMQVGEMAYDVIIVPGSHTLRSTTLERLEQFAAAGGRVIFMGEAPKWVDAQESDRAQKLAASCEQIDFSRNALLNRLENHREVDIRRANGSRSDNVIYQMREDGDDRWLFFAHVQTGDMLRRDSGAYIEADFKEDCIIKIKGEWNPVLYDTLTGEVSDFPAEVRDGETWLRKTFYVQDSLLLQLQPGAPKAAPQSSEVKSVSAVVELSDPSAVTLSEPNVVLLDLAEYALDGEDWRAEEELLRLDNACRERLGWPKRGNSIVQPWAQEKTDEPAHELALRFTVHSEIAVGAPMLAMERPDLARVWVNGAAVKVEPTGYFVDESIQSFAIPALPVGASEIIIKLPLTRTSNTEWCYLLGDFGVRVEGRQAVITEPVKTLAFGDWVPQGLPFYAGNVTYQIPFEADGGALTLQVPRFTNPVLTVRVDGVEQGPIAFAPFTLDLGKLSAGNHMLEITAFGNRVNAFGQVHNAIQHYKWYGPDAWRTTGNGWAYEYQLWRMGILQSPKLLLAD